MSLFTSRIANLRYAAETAFLFYLWLDLQASSINILPFFMGRPHTKPGVDSMIPSGVTLHNFFIFFGGGGGEIKMD